MFILTEQLNIHRKMPERQDDMLDWLKENSLSEMSGVYESSAYWQEFTHATVLTEPKFHSGPFSMGFSMWEPRVYWESIGVLQFALLTVEQKEEKSNCTPQAFHSTGL